jgi:AcrR family transcriptional regulator
MPPAARHRHPIDGGYPRGGETRARIVTAALGLFGERGFEGASTRDIAERAGVNAPAIGYYFENKEGVYLACVEHIAARVWEHVSRVITAAQDALDRHADDYELIDAFCAIQTSIAEFMFTSTDADDWRQFMAREQAGLGPASGFEMINNRLSSRMIGVSAAVTGRLLGRAADEEETLIRSLTLNAPLLAFHITGRSSLSALGWDVVDTSRLSKLLAVITEQTVVLLRHMAETKRSRA